MGEEERLRARIAHLEIQLRSAREDADRAWAARDQALYVRDKELARVEDMKTQRDEAIALADYLERKAQGIQEPQLVRPWRGGIEKVYESMAELLNRVKTAMGSDSWDDAVAEVERRSKSGP